MKKFLLVLVFVALGLVSNAQFFVAGSVSANHTSGETRYEAPFMTVDLAPVKSGFSVTPAFGYMIPGKSYGFGLGLGYAYASEKDNDWTASNGDVIVESYKKNYSNTFDFGPFFRYAYARFDKITLYVDAKMPISISQANTKIGDVVNEGNNTLAIGGRLIPGLTYKFNNHILFTTEIGLLSINYNHTKTTSADGNVTVKTNDFKLGANTRQVASFGFVYLF
ncbi:MAG: hypothetical protein IKU01_00830 [Bacteroidales bacterium]|nr:hypothetical protein [Bacteroidales bacterium]